MSHIVRVLLRGLMALSLAAACAAVVAPPAGAGQGIGQPRLSVSVQTAQASKVTDVIVTGSDYLVPPYAPGTDVFGGIYVFFGWVADPTSFGPSTRNSQNNNGTMGVTYLYPGDGGDPGTRDPGTGTMRMVAFTPGSESGKATKFHMDRDGNWTTSMRIYSSVFSAKLPSGEVRTVDCQKLISGQCGIFTVGAHGKSSATNEKFVPIRFSGSSPAAPPPAVSAGNSDSSGGPAKTSHGTAADGSDRSSGSSGGRVSSPDGSTETGVNGKPLNGPEDAAAGSGEPGVSLATGSDEVPLDEVGRRRSDAALQRQGGAEPIVASVEAIDSEWGGASFVLAAVLVAVAVVVAVVVMRSRNTAGNREK